MKDDQLEMTLYFDFYGELLGDSQKQVVELYVNEDLSLAEVADILKISRQGVRDSLTRDEKKLIEYEEKLGMLQTYRERTDRDARIRHKIHEIRRSTDDDYIIETLNEIEDLLKGDESDGI